MDTIILYDVDFDEEHPYTMYFKFRKIKNYSNKIFILEYIGADIQSHDIYIPEERKEKPLRELNAIFDYGPFTREMVKDAKSRLQEKPIQLTW